MTELDLGLKVGVRQLFWSMGLSTRLDVELRGFSPPPKAGARPRAAQTFTDLDVLGVSVNNGFRVSTEIADCKTSQRDSTSRMFWVRGVADLFGADHAYLVREHNVTDAARQLSARLGVAVLPSEDLVRLQAHYPSLAAGAESPMSVLFDRKAVAEHLAAFSGLDRRLKNLLDYRQFDYWVYEPHRNPIQMVAHLAGARAELDSRNPIHVALFLDMTWLYLLALIRVTEHIRNAFLSDPDRGLQEYLSGGATNLREKQQTASVLAALATETGTPVSYLPEYYNLLRELVVRLLRRPAQMQAGLRYTELSAALAAARKRVTVSDAVGAETFDAIAAKMAADVCGFLVAAAQLDNGFRSRARAYLLGEPLEQTAPPRRDSTGPETATAPTPTQSPATTTSPTPDSAEQGDQAEIPLGGAEPA